MRCSSRTAACVSRSSKGVAAYAHDPSAYRALTAALRDDRSFAVQAAAAAGLGSEGDPGAFGVLREDAEKRGEIHVMQGVFAGLVATRDPRAIPILLADARPGVPERLRVQALKALAGSSGFTPAADKSAVAAAVRAALDDPTLFIRQAGESLAGAYGLAAFESEIGTIARTAPTAFERDAAGAALQELRRNSTAAHTPSPNAQSSR